MADGRNITVSTALGDKLLFAQMEGFDEISRCFRYETGLVSKDIDIKAEDILGTPVTITVRTASAKRFFHGIVSEFAFQQFREEYAQYSVVLRPWLWFLVNHSDNRIFQKKSVVDILEEVFKDHANVKVEKRLKKSYPPREYCVQYRETDLDFVQRLMEHEGIFYHFDHADGEHTLVLSDANASVKDAEGFETIKFQGEGGNVVGKDDVISTLFPRASVRSGTYVHTDYDFKKPATDLMTKSDAPKSNALADGELYHYPGTYLEVGDGEPLAAVRLEEAQAPHVRVEATANRWRQFVWKKLRRPIFASKPSRMFGGFGPGSASRWRNSNVRTRTRSTLCCRPSTKCGTTSIARGRSGRVKASASA